ncbi:diguanylate cyclase domain-containing protein [Pseudolysinimonas sp.]|uniref:diguanylate cyclase domain-containing protein n=1 Tax=Pseudolysinimonas sp. TaxID=2680009 RepID=UPI003F7E4E2C
MNLDITTVAAVSGIIVIICGVTFILNTTLRRNDLVGRIWSVAFVAAILETIAYTVQGMEPSAWWAIAIGNSALVFAIGVLWSGSRAANERRPLYPIPLAVAVIVGAAVLLRGPAGGPWAGSVEMFTATAVFAGLGFVETSRGWLARSLNARILGIASLVMALYYAARAVLILILGHRDPVFATGFGTIPATIIDMGLVVIGTVTISLIQQERFKRPGLVIPSDSEAEGLMSPGAFRAVAETWLRRSVRDRVTLALVLVELANIDEINLAFGRLMGDNAIRLMGRLAVGDAPAAALVGRLSRRRFAILFPMEDEDDARIVADRINSDALTSPIDDADRFRAATFTGITSTRAAGSRYDDLVETAEAVLDLAIDSGKPGTIEYAA